MIRKCSPNDFKKIYEIINESSQAYKGVIPSDLWKEPYMPEEELQHEIESGVKFWAYEEYGELIGVMGIQDIKDVTLIRHAYVLPEKRRKGIGSKLLTFLRNQTDRPILIGTWRDASWAISFYEKHGFKLVDQEERDRLLRKYWSISQRQREGSVVLANKKWFKLKESDQ